MAKKVFDFFDRTAQRVQMVALGEVMVGHTTPAEMIMTATAIVAVVWLIFLTALMD